jgi:hypothetical protein
MSSNASASSTSQQNDDDRNLNQRDSPMDHERSLTNTLAIVSTRIHSGPGMNELMTKVGGQEQFNILMKSMEASTFSDGMVATLRQMWKVNGEASTAISYLQTSPAFFEAFVRSCPTKSYGYGSEVLIKKWAVEKYKSRKPRLDIDRIL